VVRRVEYGKDYEVISTVAKLEKEEQVTEFFLHLDSLLNSIRREEKPFDEKFLEQYEKEREKIESLEYEKLKAARRNSITEIDNLLTPEEQEIVLSHQIQINIPYLKILPTYCSCEIPPNYIITFFGRDFFNRKKNFVGGYYHTREQIHYNHINCCLKTPGQINEFKNRVIAAIQKERPIFSETIKSIIISKEEEKAKKKKLEELEKAKKLLIQKEIQRLKTQNYIGKIITILIFAILGIMTIEKLFWKKTKIIKQSKKNNY
ncbi:16240_t:CDS:2, partial [Racocetra fulgida]